MKKILIFLNIVKYLIFIILLFEESFANIYYVSPNGSNNNNGSLGSPWQTIMHSVKNTGPGDTIMVRNGTYNEEVWIKGQLGQGGSAGQYLTLQSFPGEEVILLDKIIVDADYVRIKNFHLEAPGGTIVVVDWGGYGYYVQILNNEFTGAYILYSAPIAVSGSDCLIENNTLNLSHTGTQTHAIYIMAGKKKFENHNTIIRNNTITNPSHYGIHIYDQQKNPQDSIRVISNVIVENNFISNSDLKSGIVISTGTDTRIQGVLVRNNVIVSNKKHGIAITNWGLGIDSLKIFNNTIYEFNNSGIFVGSGVANVSMMNNIIDYGNIQASYHINNYGNSTSVVADNNLYWPGTPHFNNLTDFHLVIGDPIYISSANDDFHLQENSIAIDTGITLIEVPTDKDGNQRPVDGNGDGIAKYDIGAFEFIPSTMGLRHSKEFMENDKMSLYQNYPNPFNPITSIR